MNMPTDVDAEKGDKDSGENMNHNSIHRGNFSDQVKGISKNQSNNYFDKM